MNLKQKKLWIAMIIAAILANICLAEEQKLKADDKQIDQTMTKYMNDLKLLKQSVRNLNETLVQSKGDVTLSLQKLQQGMANERDILFNIQSYLFLPESVTTCECFNIDQQAKKKLNNDISNILISLENLQRLILTLPQCSDLKEVSAEAQRQLSYTKVINLTLNRDCCGERKQKTPSQTASGLVDISKSNYQTNIKAKNWIFDGMSQSELRLKYFQQSARQNISNCPLQFPFFKGGQCIQCQMAFPLWSMKLQRCVNCPDKSYFNQSSRNCIKKTGSLREVDVIVEPIRQVKETYIVPPIVGQPIYETIRKSKNKTFTKMVPANIEQVQIVEPIRQPH